MVGMVGAPSPGAGVVGERPWALVLGASRGIGRECALALAASGFDVALGARTARRDQALLHGLGAEPVALAGSLEETAREARARGARTLELALDLNDEAACTAAVEALARRPGGLRCVVNSGVYKGASDLARVLDLAPHDYRAMVQCNVLTPLAVFRAALRAMLRQGGAGSLVQVSSSSVGMTPRASVDKGGWDFGYVSTKAAIAKLMPLLALEHPPAPGAPDALRFFNVEPGLVVTELMKHKGLSGSYTAGFGDVPPQVAGAVVAHLCSQPFAAVSRFNGKSVYAPRLCEELQLLPGYKEVTNGYKELAMKATPRL